MGVFVWQTAHWLDHVVHWLYRLSDRLENKSCTHQDPARTKISRRDRDWPWCS